MIEIWHENCKEMRAHEIIDTFQEHKVSSYFQRELNMTGRNPEAVYGRLHFTKEYCFTEYHRFPDLLFAGSIQYDDDCHVK